MTKKLLILLLLCATSALHAANYLTFTAEADSSSFGIINVGSNNPNVQYSLDKGKLWMTLDTNTVVTLAKKGDKALLKGMNPNGFSKEDSIYSRFVMTGRIAASGSVMSLIDGEGESLVIPGEYCFYRLFEKCVSLAQAPQLPAHTLREECYKEIFIECTSLTQAPKLPAKTLEKNCYAGMFKGCTSLTKAPKLPATTLARECYRSMFSRCIFLKHVPKLPATELSEECYEEMFSECTNLTQAPELPATQLAKMCYWAMFRGCTNLAQAPQLPATKLADEC